MPKNSYPAHLMGVGTVSGITKARKIYGMVTFLEQMHERIYVKLQQIENKTKNLSKNITHLQAKKEAFKALQRLDGSKPPASRSYQAAQFSDDGDAPVAPPASDVAHALGADDHGGDGGRSEAVRAGMR